MDTLSAGSHPENYEIKKMNHRLGGDGYTGKCPGCGKRKRLLGAVETRRGSTVLIWYMSCRCGYISEIGPTAKIERLIARANAAPDA
jgi:hypothetical protein